MHPKIKWYHKAASFCVAIAALALCMDIQIYAGFMIYLMFTMIVEVVYMACVSAIGYVYEGKWVNPPTRSFIYDMASTKADKERDIG